MQYTTIIFSIVLATAVAAEGDSAMSMDMSMGTKATKAMTEAGMCKMMRQENQIIALAANSTKLDMITKGNTTKADAIKAKATEAQTQLTMMQSNATLMAACEMINAQADEANQCTQSFLLAKFVAFAGNESAVATATSNDPTKIAAIQLKASQATAKLDTLNANTTLQADCPAVMQKEECKFMNGLMKFVSFANNQTMLDMVTKSNATKEDQIKKLADQAQMQLTAMQSNSTMTAACDALKAQSDKGTTQSATSSASTTNNSISSNKKSAAGLERLPSAGLAAVSTIVALAVGMFML